ncbi:uncharacterized protein RHOBADRAFT_45182, partial [Rhodotorula graminis WP1]
LARAFRNRLALASYKASRGWHDVGLDTIEPHLEQEAQRRSQGPVAAAPAAQHYPSQPLAHQAYAPQPHQPVYQQQQQQHEHTPQYDMHAVLGAPSPSSHPHKRARLDDPYQHARSRPAPQQQQQQQQADMYSAHSVYAPPPQPVHTVSPYSTASVYHREPAGSSSSRPPFAPQPDLAAPSTAPPAAAARKQRASASAAPAAGAASPSSRAGSSRPRRVPSRRSSPAKGPGSRPGEALSSSDPTFSSFVDAATALTGMARAPSDPSSQGSGSDEGGAGGGSRSAAARGMDVDGHGQGADDRGEVEDGGRRAPFARPATPERQIVKLDGVGAPGGGSAGANDSGTAEGAAELMLYLAASPSPVQSRKAPPTTLGDGSGIKGRRLFSGMGMDAGDDASSAAGAGGSGQDPGSIFGGELGGAHPAGALDAPFATSSTAPTSSTTAPSSAPLEPVKSGGATSGPSGVFGGGPSGPATPGRQRQPSLGGAASWELFINASPSPKRGGASGGAGAAAGAGMASTRGASPPHAAIGA